MGESKKRNLTGRATLSDIDGRPFWDRESPIAKRKKRSQSGTSFCKEPTINILTV